MNDEMTARETWAEFDKICDRYYEIGDAAQNDAGELRHRYLKKSEAGTDTHNEKIELADLAELCSQQAGDYFSNHSMARKAKREFGNFARQIRPPVISDANISRRWRSGRMKIVRRVGQQIAVITRTKNDTTPLESDCDSMWDLQDKVPKSTNELIAAAKKSVEDIEVQYQAWMFLPKSGIQLFMGQSAEDMADIIAKLPAYGDKDEDGVRDAAVKRINEIRDGELLMFTEEESDKKTDDGKKQWVATYLPCYCERDDTNFYADIMTEVKKVNKIK